jgi:hypothetical protein
LLSAPSAKPLRRFLVVIIDEFIAHIRIEKDKVVSLSSGDHNIGFGTDLGSSIF